MKIQAIKPCFIHPAAGGPTKSPQTGQIRTDNYDTIHIQKEEEETAFRNELVSRIWTDVRRGASADKLSDLTARIQSGSYQPNAEAIALRIMNLGIIPPTPVESHNE